jgi:hypothetical protein
MRGPTASPSNLKLRTADLGSRLLDDDANTFSRFGILSRNPSSREKRSGPPKDLAVKAVR